MKHYQVRFAKRIENDGTIITFPDLAKVYESHNQKTLKGSKSLDEAIDIGKKLNSNLPSEVKGIVIVQFIPGEAVIAIGSVMKPHIKGQIRKPGTTKWLRFIDRDSKVFSVSPQSHTIINI